MVAHSFSPDISSWAIMWQCTCNIARQRLSMHLSVDHLATRAEEWRAQRRRAAKGAAAFEHVDGTRLGVPRLSGSSSAWNCSIMRRTVNRGTQLWT